MGVRSGTYSPVPGTLGIKIPALAYRKIISVKRDGIGHDIITSGFAGNRQVRYIALYGGFGFDQEFPVYLGNNDPTGSKQRDKIHIIWDE